MAPDAICAVINGDLDRMLRIGDPGIQLGPRNTHQPAGHVEPERTGVVFHHPVDRITRQSALTGKHGYAAVLQPAEPALGRGPERAIAIELKVIHTTHTQAVGLSVRGADFTVLEVRYATFAKSKP